MTTTLDITRDHCPMTFVKVKLALSKLEAGDLLEVTLRGDEPFVNIPRSAEEQGHRIVTVEGSGEAAKIVIQKGI